MRCPRPVIDFPAGKKIKKKWNTVHSLRVISFIDDKRLSQVERAENFLLSAEDWNAIKQNKFSGQDYFLLWVLVRKLNGRDTT